MKTPRVPRCRRLRWPRPGFGLCMAGWLAWIGQVSAASPGPASSGSSPGPAPLSRSERTNYASFRLINERNIFNANRSGGRGSERRRDQSRPSRSDTVSLVGTLHGDKGSLAFFDGSSSEFRKALKPGESVAGYRVLEVQNNTVSLENGTNRVELAVGMQLRREEDGPWSVRGLGEQGTERFERSGERPREESGESTRADSASGSGSSGGGSSSEDEILKRMMQQREQELK